MSTLLAPFMRYITGGLAIALLIFIGLWKMEQNRAGRLADKLTAERSLRIADRKAYEAAQAEADKRNKETVKKIEEQHEQISDRVRSDYQRDLERLRRQAPGSKASGPGVSSVPKATGGADADGVPDPSCDDLCASEIELRLMHLQNWVRGQLGASPSPR